MANSRVQSDSAGSPRAERPRNELPGFWRNLATILHKNWLLRRQRCGRVSLLTNGVIAEILLPSIIFVALVPVWKVVDTDDKPDQLFEQRIDTRAFFNGQPAGAPPCGYAAQLPEWRDSLGNPPPQAVHLGPALAVCDQIARTPKCKRYGSNDTDPRLPQNECAPPCSSGPTGPLCQNEDACIGALCIQLGDKTVNTGTGDQEVNMTGCNFFTLYPFMYTYDIFANYNWTDAQNVTHKCGSAAAQVVPPDFDTVAVLRKFAELRPDSSVADTLGDAVKTGHRLAVVAPGGPNALTAELHEYLLGNSTNATMQPSFGNTYTYQFLQEDLQPEWTEATAVDYATGSGSSKVWGLISMKDALTYDLRMNKTATPETKKQNMLFVSKGLGKEYQQYLKGGFLTVQQLVDEFILKKAGAGNVGPTDPWLAPMPLVSYTENPFLSLVGGFLAFFMAVVLLYPVSQLVSAMVREKEMRIREVMLIMGLSPTAFRLSWFMTSALQMFVSCLIGTFVLKVTYLAKADYIILLSIFVLYFWSVTALAILIASFFSKAQLASVAGPVIFFATVIVGQSIPEDVGSGTMNSVSIFSTYPFTQAMQLVSDYEAAGIGIKWEHMYKDKPYSLGTAYIWLVFDLVLAMVLAWYVDNVLPQEWGTPQHPLFIFFPSYWCPKATESKTRATALARTGSQRLSRSRHATVEVIEDIDPAMMQYRQVAISNLRKEFKLDDGSKFVAVRDISLDMFEGQIQALLGHNGAGKTTAINMLTGMLPIDGGDAVIYDHSCRFQMPLCRADISICPQHNVLWDTLTCCDHLRFFAKLKGVPADEIEGRVDRCLREVELDDKKYVNSSSLSGGMKRKLSVAITLIGDSRFCIFDEPTAGMDVQARRAIWDLLKRSKRGRTILLTTHFMDEADLLGDSIAIMHKGMLPYWGSSLFLKSRLGVGYSLRIDFQGKDEDKPKVLRLITDKIREDPDYKDTEIDCITDAGKELAYRLPLTATKRFGDLFRELEAPQAAQLGIVDYGISVTTLEEIFLKIAQDDIEEEPAEEDMMSSDASPAGSPKGVVLGQPVPPEKEGLLDEHRVNVGSGVGSARGWEVPAEDLLRDRELYRSQWSGLLMKRFNNYKRDKKLLCCQLILPVILITVACAIDQIPTADPPALTLVGYGDDDLDSLFPIAPANAPLRDNIRPGFFDVQQRSEANATAFNQWLLDSFNDRDSDVHRHQAVFQDEAGASTIFHNSSSKHSSAILLNTVATARLREGTGQDTFINARNYPLPLSEYRKNVLQGVQTVSKVGLIFAPFTFVPSVFAGFLVLERMRKAKLVQLVSGVRLSAYWLSNFVFDLFLYCITVVLGIIVLGMFGRDEYTSVNQGHLPATVLLLLFYGLAGIGVSYWFSFYFESHTTAQNMLLLGNFLPATILLTVTTILQMIDSTRKVGEALLYIFRLFPAFALGEGLQALALRELYSTLGYGNTGPFAVCSGYGCNGIGTALIYLAVETPIIYGIILLIEKPELAYKLGLRKRHDDDDGESQMRTTRMDEVEDTDVREERQAVESGRRDGDLVVVKRLHHEYPSRGGVAKKLAVRHMSFAVPGAEIFGFLGTNGAGKTTTISIMAGEFPSTGGSVTIAGHDIIQDTQVARQRIGYCPQFDALLDLLTPRETIEFYCSLRGIPIADRARVVDALLKDLGLRQHQGKQNKSLSGGNKRKTSICIALVGGPSVVLLDEPTAGMDPAARRGLWNSLKKVGQGRCVVLTTHHLEEVEALAQRVGIMVDGKLECLGTLQHLKDKFGKGYEMEVKLSDMDGVERMKEFVTAEFGSQAELTETAGLRLTFQLPKGVRPLSDIFDLVEDNKQRLGLVDYAVKQTSLEQVFMAICRKHLEQEDRDHGGHPAPDADAEQAAEAQLVE